MRPSSFAVGVAEGVAGTAAMTATLALEKAARRHAAGPVDYDASSHVVTAASAVLHHRPQTPRGRTALFLLVHWGYGSAVAGPYPALRRRLGRGRARLLFYAGCQTMAMTLFPTLGGTPPPWRWRTSILLSSLVQHALYALVVDTADRLIENGSLPPRPTVSVSR